MSRVSDSETHHDFAEFEIHLGDYTVRLARGGEERRQAQRLRYEVFNLELGEGFAEAARTGLDADRFDPQCDHLLLFDRAGPTVVGTYRMQPVARAREGLGLYCAGEFDLDHLPVRVLDSAIELGRACIHQDHRHGPALFALWRGLAAYLGHHRKHQLFGCCSLTGTDPRLGLIAECWLRENGEMHPDLRVPVRASHACEGAEPSEAEVARFVLPKLFSTYLRFSARVCSGPALDRDFGTIDFLVLMDTATFDPRLRAMFFSS